MHRTEVVQRTRRLVARWLRCSHASRDFRWLHSRRLSPPMSRHATLAFVSGINPHTVLKIYIWSLLFVNVRCFVWTWVSDIVRSTRTRTFTAILSNYRLIFCRTCWCSCTSPICFARSSRYTSASFSLKQSQDCLSISHHSSFENFWIRGYFVRNISFMDSTLC